MPRQFFFVLLLQSCSGPTAYTKYGSLTNDTCKYSYKLVELQPIQFNGIALLKLFVWDSKFILPCLFTDHIKQQGYAEDQIFCVQKSRVRMSPIKAYVATADFYMNSGRGGALGNSDSGQCRITTTPSESKLTWTVDQNQSTPTSFKNKFTFLGAEYKDQQ